jgi:hypothetical protein
MRKRMGVAAVAASALVLTTPLSAMAAGSSTDWLRAAGKPAASSTPAVSRAAAPRVTVVNRKVVLPFGLAVSHGRVYVADGATHTVSRVVGGNLRTVAVGEQGKPGEGDVAGIAVSRDGRRLAFTNTVDESHAKTTLEILGPLGSRVSADLAGHEAKANPDQKKRYGILNPSQCVIDAFKAHEKELGPVNYYGEKDSHPYAVAAVGKHWVVADAGGNDLLRVSNSGKVSTVAVLPRQALKITKEIASGLGLPDCVAGFTYYFEPVPTDVEVGPHGMLYVSILAGGPEGPAFGARSKVYRVNPRTGRATLVGSHLSGATDIALRGGKIYVAELFAGRISVLKHGRPQTYAALPNALSVEAAGGRLWAGTLAPGIFEGEPTGPGTIVRIR